MGGPGAWASRTHGPQGPGPQGPGAPWGTRGRDSPDDLKKFLLYILVEHFSESILLINLSQTAYFDGLTLPDCRKWYCDSTGLNIIFIRAIGARNIKCY